MIDADTGTCYRLLTFGQSTSAYCGDLVVPDANVHCLFELKFEYLLFFLWQKARQSEGKAQSINNQALRKDEFFAGITDECLRRFVKDKLREHAPGNGNGLIQEVVLGSGDGLALLYFRQELFEQRLKALLAKLRDCIEPTFLCQKQTAEKEEEALVRSLELMKHYLPIDFFA